MKNKPNIITKNQWMGFGAAMAVVIGVLIYANLKGIAVERQENHFSTYPFGQAITPQTLAPLPYALPVLPPAQLKAPAPAPKLRPAATATAVQEAVNQAVAKVRPSIVAILRPAAKTAQKGTTSGLAFVQPNNTGNTTTGSGVIIDPAGYILTTFQTIGKAEEVKVKLFSALENQFTAEVVAVDTKTDLALLKIDAPGVYPAVVIGDSDAVEIGDIVFAIGTPYGFSRSVSMGIVSTNRRKISIDGRWYPDLIQTDASINTGDDGGALINIRGELIGINMAYFIPDSHFTGIGFAVPINDAAMLRGRI